MSGIPEPPIWKEVQRRPHLALSERALVWARLGAAPEGFDQASTSDAELRHVLETIARDFDALIMELNGVDQIRSRLRERWQISKVRIHLTHDAVDCEVVLGESREMHQVTGRGAHLAGRMLADGLPLPESGAPIKERPEAQVLPDEHDEPTLVLRIGDADLSDAIMGKVQLWSEDGMPGGSVTLSREALDAASVDYLAEVRMLAVSRARQAALFTGLVDRVTHGDEASELELVSMGVPFTEMGIGGLGVGAGVDPLELIWALFRSSGMPEDRIDLEGFNPGPIEVFDVIVPLEGIDLQADMSIAGVTMSADPSIKKLPKRLGPRELRKRFRSAGAWAVGRVEEKTLWGAEIEGSALIATALSWMTASAHYSFNKNPLGGLAEFDRAWYRSRIQVQDVILVRGLTTGRTWLRAPTDIIYVPVAESEALGRFPPTESLASLNPQFREALAAWRRAATETDPVVAVNSLWEAVEFYVSGIKVPKLFNRSQLEKIRIAAVQGLQENQVSRVKHRLAELNTPPLMVRLRATLERDGVPFDGDDLAVLARVRRSRNEFQHGRSREIPAEDDLRRAVAFLNRAIVHSALRRHRGLQLARSKE